MVRLPGVELGMKRTLVVEVTIAAVDRQQRRRNGDEDSARSAADGCMLLARSDDDDFVAEAGRSAELRIHIGPNSAAGWRVEGANVDDPHMAGTEPTMRIKLK